MISNKGFKSQKKILKSASLLFAKKGYERTSIREIATAANLNLATIYYYFSSKEQLYLAVFKEALKPLLKIISALDQNSLEPKAKLDFFISNYTAFLSKKPALMNFMLHEIINKRKMSKIIAQDYIKPIFLKLKEILAQILEENSNIADGATAKKFREDLLVYNLLGMIAFIFISYPISLKVLGLKKYDQNFVTDFINNTKEVFFHGICS